MSLFGLFRRRGSAFGTDYRVPDATRIYAIGDIHGCRDELEKLLDRIAEDVAAFDGMVHIVCLGDLVDRGLDSAGVVELMCQLSSSGLALTVLMGNHEEALLSAFDGNSDGRTWLGFGGMQTLESYGVTRAEQFERNFDLHARMLEAIPHDHIEFLRSLPDKVRIGDYLFVHAGIRPGIPIARQQGNDLRWIRDPFLGSDADHGVVVVHGHTISTEPQSLANRIGIDTGCYAGGPLTALVLEGSERRFLQVASTASAAT